MSLLSLFFQSCRTLNLPRLYNWLREAGEENVRDVFLLAFYLRDCRGGGKGERRLGRRCLVWLFINFPDSFMKIARLIPEYGRWDDLLELFPGRLQLFNLSYVRENFLSDINQARLSYLQFLQPKIVEIVAERLKQDKEAMTAGKPCSLCAKWVPTEGGAFDRQTGAYKTLANALKVSCKRLRQRYITPLRRYLKITEQFMCAKQWEEIEFERVPLQAMKRSRKAFMRHQPLRFLQWSSGRKLYKTLYPHELIHELRLTDGNMSGIFDPQWKEIVQEVRRTGGVDKSVAVVDMSSSMSCLEELPRDVAITMGLIVAEAGYETGLFKNRVITFSQKPKLVDIGEGPLWERVKAIQNIEWGGSINLEELFRLVLQTLKESKAYEAPKQIFVITDMEFDYMEGRPEILSNLDQYRRVYEREGYRLPRLVFWNLLGGIHLCTVSEKMSRPILSSLRFAA